MGRHTYHYYNTFLALNLMTPGILVFFTYFYISIIFLIKKWCISSQEHDTNSDGEGKVFKAFKAITVAAARGLFGAVTIRRKDNMNPPCLKIHGKLYKANVIVLLSLLHYVLAVLIAISFVSVVFSVRISNDLDDCDKNADCFILNAFNGAPDGLPDVTALTNCSLSFELQELFETDVSIECFVDHQPAVFLALLGGYITIIPPLMFSFANVVHTFIFERSLKKKLQKRVIFWAILVFSNLGPYMYSFLIIFKYYEQINLNNDNVIKFIFKDTVLGQLSTILITFSSFLSYPWFWLGSYLHKPQQEAGYDTFQDILPDHKDEIEDSELHSINDNSITYS